ncbi:MAG: uracil-DNA glycosylase [Candidatus Hatepunaea meridiana]|nr:uracil-DNA glycosylase [Candidatus Hatepunaea meridiana]
MMDCKTGLQQYFRQLAEEEPILILDRKSTPEIPETVNSNSERSEESVDDENLHKLVKLEQEVSTCTLCELSRTRHSVIFGVGNPHSRLLLIGEAPGADEDAQGIPFVGRAGKMLDKVLKDLKLERSELYIANILKCRPPGNRDPLPSEAAACLPYLLQQIELIQPDVIVALGKVAAVRLLKLSPNISVKSLRDSILEYRKRPFVVTYHPSYLLRYPGEKISVLKDMQVVLKLLSGEIKWQPGDMTKFLK